MNKVLQILKEEQKLNLEDLNINELRALGRSMALNSPTSMSKEELIEEILCVMYGADEPDELETRGRLNEDLIDAYSDENYYPVINTQDYSTATLSTSYASYEVVGRSETSSTVSDGYYEKDASNKGYIKRADGSVSIEITDAQAMAYGLSNYDNVKFKSFCSPIQNCEYLVDILSINDLVGSEITEERTPFSELIAVEPTQAHELDNTNDFVAALTNITKIPQGGRVVICGENGRTRRAMVKDLISAFTAELSTKVFPILVDYPREVVSYIKSNQPNTIYSSPFERLEENINKIMRSFNRAIKFVEAGKNAVIIIDSLNTLLYLLEESKGENGYAYAQATVMKLFNLGSNFKNGGSLTICACIDSSDNKLLDRVRSTSMIFIPVDNELVEAEVYPPFKAEKVEFELGNYFMDETAVNVVQEITQEVTENNLKSEHDSLKKPSSGVIGIDTLLNELKNK